MKINLDDLTGDQLIELVYLLADAFYEQTSIKKGHWQQIIDSCIDEVKRINKD